MHVCCLDCGLTPLRLDFGALRKLLDVNSPKRYLFCSLCSEMQFLILLFTLLPGQGRKMHCALQEIRTDSPEISKVGKDSLSKKNQEQHIFITLLKLTKLIAMLFFAWIFSNCFMN